MYCMHPRKKIRNPGKMKTPHKILLLAGLYTIVILVYTITFKGAKLDGFKHTELNYVKLIEVFNSSFDDNMFRCSEIEKKADRPF